MVEWGGLENRCGPCVHRGFESHPLRRSEDPPRQLRLHLLPDLIVLVVQLSKCEASATEIAQFALGDLTF